MSVSVFSSGTQSATLNTPHTLATPTSANVYQLLVDCSNMGSGDVVKLAIKLKVLTGGTPAVLHQETLTGAQSEPIFLSPPVTAPFGAGFTLEQTDGTGRDFDWSVLTLA